MAVRTGQGWVSVQDWKSQVERRKERHHQRRHPATSATSATKTTSQTNGSRCSGIRDEILLPVPENDLR